MTRFTQRTMKKKLFFRSDIFGFNFFALAISQNATPSPQKVGLDPRFETNTKTKIKKNEVVKKEEAEAKKQKFTATRYCLYVWYEACTAMQTFCSFFGFIYFFPILSTFHFSLSSSQFLYVQPCLSQQCRKISLGFISLSFPTWPIKVKDDVNGVSFETKQSILIFSFAFCIRKYYKLSYITF